MDIKVQKLFSDIACGMVYNYDQSKEEEILDGMLSYLNENQKYIIVKYYFDRMTDNEIGKEIGLKGRRINKIRWEILNELKCMACVKDDVIIYNVFKGKRLPESHIPFYFTGLPVKVCHALQKKGMNNLYETREYMKKNDKCLALVYGLGKSGAKLVIGKLAELRLM